MTPQGSEAEAASPPVPPKLGAVIELGTTSIRMTIAQIGTPSGYSALDTLQQGVALGKDAFTHGYIRRSTTEECVKVIRSFQHVLAEYGLTDDRQVTAIASSAVREASNRDSFLDRILVATDIDVRIMDQAEVNRFMYLAVKPDFARVRRGGSKRTVVLEVGGGSTEALVFAGNKLDSAHMYAQGSLRLRQLLEDIRAPHARTVELLREHVEHTVEQIVASLAPGASSMLALGNDARLACTVLNQRWDRKKPGRVGVSELAAFTRKVAAMSVDGVARTYSLAYPDAETLAPALLVYSGLAQALSLRHIHVGCASLRDGVLASLVTGESWTQEFKTQIVNSAVALGRRFGFDEKHAQRTARLSLLISEALRGEHALPPKYELILHMAALLHDVGHYINRSGHHKHSQYVIANSEIFGLSAKDLLLTSLVARYHRRAVPRPTHSAYMALDRQSRILVSKLAAILRIADVVAGSTALSWKGIGVRVQPGQLVMTVRSSSDVTLVQHEISERASLFESIYGMNVILRNKGRTIGDGKESADLA